MSSPASGQLVSVEPEDDPHVPVPWHFKLMVGLAALYIGWRVVQMIGWLIAWIGNRF